MIASGQEFDACIVDPTWAASSYSKGYLQDLSDVIDKYLPDWHENMNATAFDAYRYDGGVMQSLSVTSDRRCIQYRMCKTGYHGCHRHGQYRNVRRPYHI